MGQLAFQLYMLYGFVLQPPRSVKWKKLKKHLQSQQVKSRKDAVTAGYRTFLVVQNIINLVLLSVNFVEDVPDYIISLGCVSREDFIFKYKFALV